MEFLKPYILAALKLFEKIRVFRDSLVTGVVSPLWYLFCFIFYQLGLELPDKGRLSGADYSIRRNLRGLEIVCVAQ